MRRCRPVLLRNPRRSGGSGPYIKVMLYGLFRTAPPDPAIRQKLKAEADAIGSAALHRRLQGIDPEAAARIHSQDTFRIVRAYETIAATGKPITDHHRRHGFRVTLQGSQNRPRDGP